MPLILEEVKIIEECGVLREVVKEVNRWEEGHQEEVTVVALEECLWFLMNKCILYQLIFPFISQQSFGKMPLKQIFQSGFELLPLIQHGPNYEPFYG